MDHQAPCHTLTLVPSRDQLERMGDDIAELAAHLQAATYQLLRMIDQFDQLQGWAETGARSCAHWLSWRLSIGGNAAREKVRVARALAEHSPVEPGHGARPAQLLHGSGHHPGGYPGK